MCLIIHKPAGVEIPVDLLASAQVENPDGIGIMWGGSEVEKIVPGDWADPVGRAARILSRLTDRTVGVHFRWKTHGLVDWFNTHPYPLTSGSHLMHNGILSTGSFLDPARSDTWHYAEFGLNDAPAADDPHYWQHIAKDIGRGNKFLVMHPDDTWTVVNREAGCHYKGLWLSNSYSIPERRIVWDKATNTVQTVTVPSYPRSERTAWRYSYSMAPASGKGDRMTRSERRKAKRGWVAHGLKAGESAPALPAPKAPSPNPPRDTYGEGPAVMGRMVDWSDRMPPAEADPHDQDGIRDGLARWIARAVYGKNGTGR